MKPLAEAYRFLSFSLAKNPLEANIGYVSNLYYMLLITLKTSNKKTEFIIFAGFLDLLKINYFEKVCDILGALSRRYPSLWNKKST